MSRCKNCSCESCRKEPVFEPPFYGPPTLAEFNSPLYQLNWHFMRAYQNRDLSKLFPGIALLDKLP